MKTYNLYRLDRKDVSENDIRGLKENLSVIISDYPYEYCHGFLSFHCLSDTIVIADSGKVIFKGKGFPPEFFDRDDNRNLEEAIAFVESTLL